MTLVEAKKLEGGIVMRTISIVLAATLAVCLVDAQAFAASNPDRTYYRGAGSCGGAAYCSYRANKKVKASKKPRSSELHVLGGVPAA
jgi:hypothetical protein